MKEHADKKRTPHNFKVGDLVFVKLRPYRQNSVVGRRVHKLSKRFYGPFKILSAVGEVVFQLDLPPQSKIHTVFHVSQLKGCSDPSVVCLKNPVEAVQNQPKITPLAVLDWKLGANAADHQVLIQWQGLFLEDATWEAFDDIRTNYPEFHLEGKVFLEGEEDVMDPVIGPDISDDENEPIPQLRAKRNRNRPKYLKDYILSEALEGSR